MPPYPNQKQPLPSLTPAPLPELPQMQPIIPPPDPDSDIGRKLMMLLYACIATVIIAGGIFTYWYITGRTGAGSKYTSALTLYYSDGKTILYKSPEKVAHSPAPAFVSYVESQLQSLYGTNYLNRGTWYITTTLDASLQSNASQALQKQQKAFSAGNAVDAAFIGEDVTTGQIKSWVGSTQRNSTTDNLTQPSSVNALQLPFTYATYLSLVPGATLTSTLNDAQGPLPGFPCTDTASPATDSAANCMWDQDYKYDGPITVSQAIAGARNVPAAQAEIALNNGDTDPTSTDGINKILNLTSSAGSDGACYRVDMTTLTKSSQTQCYLGAIIGNGFLASPQHTLQAYATLGNNGNSLSQSVMLSATLNGSTVFTWSPSRVNAAMSGAVASDITETLSDPTTSWLQSDAALFMTKNKTKLATSYSGLTNESEVGAVQYSSHYAAGIWLVGEKQSSGSANATKTALSGALDTTMLPVTNRWINAAQ